MLKMREGETTSAHSVPLMACSEEPVLSCSDRLRTEARASSARMAACEQRAGWTRCSRWSLER